MKVHDRSDGRTIVSWFFERGSDQHGSASLALEVWAEGRQGPKFTLDLEFVALALTTYGGLRHKRAPTHLPGSNIVSTVEARPW